MDAMRRNYVFLLGLVLSYLCCAGTAAALEPSIDYIGEVVGSGEVEMRILDRWVSVSGKTYPFGDGVSLRSGDGTMAITLRDAVRMQVGKGSACEIAGEKGAYHVRLNTGGIGFSVPRGTSLIITTPAGEVRTQGRTGMARKVNSETDGSSRGFVVIDGRGAKVISVSGTLSVAGKNGKNEEKVEDGKAAYIADSQDGALVASSVPMGGAGGLAGAAGKNPALSPIAIAGGAVALAGGGFGLVYSKANKPRKQDPWPPASPSRP